MNIYLPGQKACLEAHFFRFILRWIRKTLETQIEGLLVCRRLQTRSYEHVCLFACVCLDL